MKNEKRREMLKILARAKDACRPDGCLHQLQTQIGKAMDFLLLLVAGERLTAPNAPAVDLHRLCSSEMPLIDRLKLIEGEVREVYADFEDAVAKEKYEDGPALTLGDRMVLNVVDDAVWMISGMFDDLREEADGKA